MTDRELTRQATIWLTHVEACAAAGCSMKTCVEEHGLDLQSFYLWKGRLKKLRLVAGRSDQAVPRLQVLPLSAPGRRSHDRRTRIELANGISIDAPQDIDIVGLARDAVDFRKGINGLSVLVEEQLAHDPFSGQLFCVCQLT